MIEIKDVIKRISNLIIAYNKELKKKNWKNLQLEVDKVFEFNHLKYSKLVRMNRSTSCINFLKNYIKVFYLTV